MAEGIADDDEEGFGDFKFVSSSNHSNQINRSDEDDWGDFMDNFSPNQDLFRDSLQFQSFNGFIQPQNPSNQSESSLNFDPFGFVSDNSTITTESEPIRVESEKNSASPDVQKRWEKPRGALPLSIFGDEEEESDSVNPSLDNASDMFSPKPAAATMGNGLNFGSGISVNDIIVNLYTQAEQIKDETDSNFNLVDENADFNDDGWEFKDAFSENVDVNGGSLVKAENSELLGIQEDTTSIKQEIQVDEKRWSYSEEAIESYGFGNSKQDSGDLFTTSDGFSQKPAEFDDRFNFETDATTHSDLYTQDKHIRAETGFSSYSVDRNFDSGENFWELEDLFSGAGDVNSSSNQKGELKVAGLSDLETNFLSFNGEIKGNGKESGSHQGVIPFSIFGNGKLDSEHSSNGQDLLLDKPTTYVRNGINNQGFGSNVSVIDLISNLYSQAEQISTVDSSEKISRNSNSSQMGLNPNSLNGEVDYDDSAWEFKDASLETRAEDQSHLSSPEGTHYTESKLKNFVDFYCRLKEETSSISLSHLYNLKKVDAEAVAVHEEIQAAYKKFYQENVLSEEAKSVEQPPKKYHVEKLLAILQEPGFQLLDSEYDLSERISQAEKDLNSATGLFEHAISMLKILSMKSMEEQSSYVTTWFKMISVCSQELKHGALIWKQSSEKNAHKLVLSEPRGQQYIIALGEIYRVVEILRVSATLYKPWILSSLGDPNDISTLLEECSTAWSDSGLKEALQSISDPFGFGYEGTTKSLLDSIKSLHDLDVIAVQNHLLTQQEPICRLSALSLGMVPDMKVAVWNGEHYFLTLANLWVNRISCDPPNI